MKNLIEFIILSLIVKSNAYPQFNPFFQNGNFPNIQQGFPNRFPPNRQMGFPNQQGAFLNQQGGFPSQQINQQQQQPNNQQVFQQQQFNPSTSSQNTQFFQNQPPGEGPVAVPASFASTPAFLRCMRNECLTTNEYNPICGTDQVAYSNKQKLDCTNQCGRRLNPNWQQISVLRVGACASGQRVS